MKRIINKNKRQTCFMRQFFGFLNKKIVGFSESGFTLVEVLVVISIIAIISAVLSGGYINSQKNARDAQRKLNLKEMAKSLDMYFADYGEFPDPEEIGNLIISSGELNDGKGTVYIKKMPKEPGSMGEIQYMRRSSDNKAYKLFTNLENIEDSSCFNKDDCSDWGYKIITKGCCYVVTSSNIGVSEPML